MKQKDRDEVQEMMNSMQTNARSDVRVAVQDFFADCGIGVILGFFAAGVIYLTGASICVLVGVCQMVVPDPMAIYSSLAGAIVGGVLGIAVWCMDI